MEDIARLRHGGSCEVGAWRLVWLRGGEDRRGGMDAPGAHYRSLISSRRMCSSVLYKYFYTFNNELVICPCIATVYKIFDKILVHNYYIKRNKVAYQWW